MENLLNSYVKGLKTVAKTVAPASYNKASSLYNSMKQPAQAPMNFPVNAEASITKPVAPITTANPAAVSPALKTPAAKAYVASQVSTPQVTIPQGGAPVIQPATTPVPTTPTGGQQFVSSPGSPSSTGNSAMDSYITAYKNYLDKQANNSEVSEAKKYLNQLIMDDKKAQEKARNSGETMGFAGGEQARVARNNSFAIDAATGNLGVLQQDQENVVNAAKSGVDLQKDLLGLSRDDAKIERDTKANEAKAAFEEKKFEEDVRQFGVETALKNRQVAIDERKASSGGTTSGGYNGNGTVQLSALAQAVQNGTVDINKLTPTDRAKVASELVNAGVKSNRQETLSSNLQVTQDLIDNPNLSKITGFAQGKLRIGDLDPRAQLALNQYNQLKGILSLENREKLKGSGAISDFEFKVLEQAATALGRNLDDKSFKDQLGKVKEIFEGKYAYTRAGSGDTSVPSTGAKSGTTTSGIKYTIE